MIQESKNPDSRPEIIQNQDSRPKTGTKTKSRLFYFNKLFKILFGNKSMSFNSRSLECSEESKLRFDQ